jgi:hypothetical protein
MALGIAAGTVARRTLPAIAVALGGFIALRLVISDFLRPLLAVPGHRDGDLPPAGRGADRGHVRHRPHQGRIIRAVRFRPG